MHEDACLLFASVDGNAYAATAYQQTRSSLGGLCDVVRVLHTRDAPTRAFDPESATLFLNDAEVLASFPHRKDVTSGVLPGNVDLKMVAAVRRLPGYRRFVWMEYDVMATSDLRGSVERLVHVTAKVDLAASYLARYRDDGWVWWDSLRVPQGLGCDPHELAMGGFLPLATFTRAFLDAYAEALARGFAGHQEVTLPTVARWLGASMLDLSQTSPPFTHHPQFGARAPAELDRLVPDFVHPVKSAEARARIEAELLEERSGGRWSVP